jgi:hypothetical protein
MQTEADRISRIRQSLFRLAEEIQASLPALNDRRPMIKGNVYEQLTLASLPTLVTAWVDGQVRGWSLLSRVSK